MATNLDVTSVQVTFKTLGGGLNTTSGPLGVEDNEATDIRNIDFDTFGSIVKRNGYMYLNPSPCASSGTAQGLYWYNSLSDRYPIMVNNGKIYKMDSLDGVWDDITGAVSPGTSGYDSYTKLLLHCDGSNQYTTFTDYSTSAHTMVNTESYDSYTVLMLKFENNYTDSAAGKVITSSNTSLSSSVYKTGSYSCYFNGTGWLTTPDHADFYFAAGDFTIDFYVYFTDTSGVQFFGGQVLSTNDYWEVYKQNENKLTMSFHIGGVIKGDYVANTYPFVANTWYHIAFERSTTTGKIFINGIEQAVTENNAFAANDVGNVATIFTIGNSELDKTYWVKGYLDNFRVSKGICRWTTNFIPPKGPHGIVSVENDNKKFGSGAAYFPYYSRLTSADSDDWSFSATDFTLETWINFSTLVNAQTICGQYVDANNYWYLQKGTNATGNKLSFNAKLASAEKAGYTMTSSWSATAGTWYHIAFERSTTDGLLFIDGISQALTTTTAFATNDLGNLAASFTMGFQNDTNFFEGMMDEFRISKGICRWSANFTPPVQAYGDYLKQDFETFLGDVIGTDQESIPWHWTGGDSTATNLTVVTGLTGAKYVKQFQNYLFLANVRVSGVRYPSRVYYSNIRTIETWSTTDWIEVAKDDGDEITGLKVLGDRLVVYKNSSIYVILFTGDSYIPFIMQKTNSPVGCASHCSIQEVNNGHVLLSWDGFYFFDGTSSTKMSDRINNSITGLNKDYMHKAAALYYRNKNQYICCVPSASSLYNDFAFTWNAYLNSWSVYTGMSASSMATFMVNGVEERPYFSDYDGYAYRMDYGSIDYPLKSASPIDCYFYTNWKHYDSICDNKGVPHIYLTHRNESSTTLTLGYSYDFYNGDQYTQTFSLYSTQSVTSLTTRRDLTGRGKFARFKLANNASTTTFRIDGIGTYVTRESKS